MVEYYQTKCTEYKKNSKKLWELINNTISKVRHKGNIIPFITVDGIKKHSPKDIANHFGEFYANLGLDLASKIFPGITGIDDYMMKIPRQLDSLVLRQHPWK